MTYREKELVEKRHRRIRRVKRWLRHLPRRSNMHHYPGLRYFAHVARNGPSVDFRVDQAIPAIYIGCVLTLLPLFGIQIVLAVLLALLFRANLPLLVGIQLIPTRSPSFPCILPSTR